MEILIIPSPAADSHVGSRTTHVLYSAVNLVHGE